MDLTQDAKVSTVEDRLAAPPATDEELRRLVKWVDTSIQALEEAREAAERDRDFYDGVQWSDTEQEDLRKRNQPASVFNHIQPKINYILGTEIAKRVDPEGKPRNRAHDTDAEAATDALRYVADHVDFDSTCSEVFDNVLVEGLGGFIFAPVIRRGYDGKPEVDVSCKHVPWDRILIDHMSKAKDYSDARWVGIVLWMDLEDALVHPVYGKHKEALENAVEQGLSSTDETYEDNPQQWSMKDPARVRIVQMFYKYRRTVAEAHFCGSAFVLKPQTVKLVDEDGQPWCPLMLASPFRTRRRANRPSEYYGAVRNMISPQEMLNKGRSKAMHMLNMRQVWQEDGAFTGDCAAPAHMLEEVAKPDGHITVAPKALVEGRVKVESNLELAAAHVQMMEEAKQEIDAVGPSAPVVGGDVRVRSGRAEQQRAEASSMELTPVFESMRRLKRRGYKAMWWMIRQFWPEERWLSLRDDKERTGFRFVALNRRMTRKERLTELLRKQVPLPEAIRSIGILPVEADELLAQALQVAQAQVQQQAMAMQQAGQQVPPEALQGLMQQTTMQLLAGAPKMQESFVYNDVGRTDLDIIITEAPDTAVVQQEEFDKITELAGTGMVKFPPEVIVEMSQLRNKKTLREMVKAPPPDPLQQKMQEIQLALMAAEVEKKKAEVQDTLAHAQQRMADAQFKLGPMAEKTQAQAMDHAATAGSKTLPE